MLVGISDPYSECSNFYKITVVDGTIEYEKCTDVEYCKYFHLSATLVLDIIMRLFKYDNSADTYTECVPETESFFINSKYIYCYDRRKDSIVAINIDTGLVEYL